jgi:hypothetical protein
VESKRMKHKDVSFQVVNGGEKVVVE